MLAINRWLCHQRSIRLCSQSFATTEILNFLKSFDTVPCSIYTVFRTKKVIYVTNVTIFIFGSRSIFSKIERKGEGNLRDKWLFLACVIVGVYESFIRRKNTRFFSAKIFLINSMNLKKNFFGGLEYSIEIFEYSTI